MQIINEDWLNTIDGMTVEAAIEYLRQFDSQAVLVYYQSSGDDQGVEMSSQLEIGTK